MYRISFKSFLIAFLLLFFSGSSLSQVDKIDQVEVKERHYTLLHIIKDALPKIHYKKIDIDEGVGVAWRQSLINQIDYRGVLFSQQYLTEIAQESSGLSIAYQLNMLELDKLYKLISVLYESKRDALKLQYEIASKLSKETFHKELIYSKANYLNELNIAPINNRHRDEMLRRIVSSDIAFQLREGQSFKRAQIHILERINERLILLEDKRFNSEHYFSLIVHSLLQSYDPHSRYVEPNYLSTLKASLKNKDYKIGIDVTSEDGLIIITNIIGGSAADKMGAFAVGDVISSVAINGKIFSLSEKSEAYLSSLISNIDDGGLPIHIYGKRNGAEYEAVVYRNEVERDDIKIKKYYSNYHQQSVDVMTLSSFFDGMYEQVVDALKSRNSGALVIDLRGNGGGSLHEAIQVTSLFMNGGVILTVENDGLEREISDTDDMYVEDSLILLVNGETASAAEIMAAALQHHQQAIVVGESTYGKGTVQRFIDFTDPAIEIPLDKSDLGGMLVTVSEYFTPDGRTIHNAGVIPDVEIRSNFRSHNNTSNSFSRAHEIVSPKDPISRQERIDYIKEILTQNPLYQFHIRNTLIEDNKYLSASTYEDVRGNQSFKEDRLLWYMNLNRRYQSLPIVSSLDDIEKGYMPIDVVLDAVAKSSAISK